MREFYKRKKVLITGHSGFKGSWLLRLLSHLNGNIYGMSLPPNTKPNLYSILSTECESHFLDVRDYKKTLNVFEHFKPEIVIHMAAQPLVRESYDDPLTTFETNVMGTANILQAIKEVGCVKSAVIVTTDKVYNNKEGLRAYRENDVLGGHDPYSSSKACAEFVTASYTNSFFQPNKYGSEHSTLIASARAGNVIGGGDWSKDRIIPDLIRSVFEGTSELQLRNPKAIRPWQHVLDPLLGYLILAKKLYEGNSSMSGAWNFAPEEQNFITVEELIRKGIHILGKGKYSVKADTVKHETQTLKLDATKAKTLLGWKPLLNMDDCLNWTFNWYKQYYSQGNVVKETDAQIKKYFDMTSNTGISI